MHANNSTKAIMSTQLLLLNVRPVENKLVISDLPREIKCAWLIIHVCPGEAFMMQLVFANHRRFSLVQGGLDIPIEVCVVMLFSDMKKKVLKVYKALIGDQYEKPMYM